MKNVIDPMEKWVCIWYLDFVNLIFLIFQWQSAITRDEARIIRGVLEMNHKTVKDVMTPIKHVFSLVINQKKIIIIFF